MLKNQPNNYVLIDYENVMPEDLDVLHSSQLKVFSGKCVKLIVFLGYTQSVKTISTPFALQMHKWGKKAQYVCSSAQGPNALDFHLACYLGALLIHDLSGIFHIISKDKGYDPLIKHMKERKRKVERYENIYAIPFVEKATKTDLDDNFNILVTQLIERKANRPRKENTLKNAMKSYFHNKIEEVHIHQLIKQLKNKKYITVIDGKVTYTLPSSN